MILTTAIIFLVMLCGDNRAIDIQPDTRPVELKSTFDRMLSKQIESKIIAGNFREEKQVVRKPVREPVRGCAGCWFNRWWHFERE